MKLSTNARIITADGKDIGNLNRFVLDPRTKKVTHIVFEHGLLERTEYLIPMMMVERVDEQGIHLHPLPVGQVNELPRFKEDHYMITDERALLDRGYVSDEMVRGYYYYPPAPYGSEGILRPENMYVFNPPENAPMPTQMPVTGAEPPVEKREDENIPRGTVAVQEGAKVLTSDSKHIGDVEKVFVDPESTKATHFLIGKGLLIKEQKLIPVDWVKTYTEKEVYLSLDEAFVQKLPDYKERAEGAE